MYGQTVVQPYLGILLSKKKEQTADTCNSDGSQSILLNVYRAAR